MGCLSTQAQAQARVHALTHAVSGFDNFDLLVGTFRKWQSDIVGVQEVTAPPARASLSTDDRLRGARAVGHGTAQRQVLDAFSLHSPTCTTVSRHCNTYSCLPISKLFREHVDTTFPPFGKCAASARTAESPCVFGALLHERGEEDASRDKFYARV